MKKLFVFILSVASIITTAKAQTVVVQNNDSKIEQTQDKNIFYINGIPSTQDIGGVEVKYVHNFTKYDEHLKRESTGGYAVFKNYNSCTVTVLYQINAYVDQTGSIVLKSGEQKEVFVGQYTPENMATITRKLQN